MKRLTHQLKNYINRSISRRLLFFFVPYIIALLIAVTLLSFYSFYTTLRREKENSTNILVSQISERFDFYFNDIKTVMAYISINKDVYTALTRYDHLSIEEKYVLNNTITNYMSNINIFKYHINDIILIGNNGYSTNLPTYYRLDTSKNLAESTLIKSYHPSASSHFFFTPLHQTDYYVSSAPESWVISSILPLTFEGKTLGYIQGDINDEKLREVLNTVYQQSAIEVIIITPDGQITFQRDRQNIATTVNPEIVANITGDHGSFVYTSATERELMVYRKLDVTGWYLLASVPYSTLLTPGYAISKTILLVILPISLLLALLLFVLISHQFKKPLSKLVHRMESVQMDNYQPAQIDYGVGEIADLGQTFETMLSQMNELIDQVYLAEIKKKDAEFELLRKQISPHFMYNSLQLIKAEAIFAQNKQISQIVTSLANLLRYAMDNTTTHVTVADEIRYIRDYLEIYKRRYGDKFDYQIDVAENILLGRIQKLVLQPLVENCLKHGFEEIKSGGLIQVRGWREDGCYLFAVQDNGQGITADTLAYLHQMLDQADQSSTHGIGLFNVHQRIRIECGPGYGISEITSEPGVFTRVVLRIKE